MDRGRDRRGAVRRAGGEDHVLGARGRGGGAAGVRRPRGRADRHAADDQLLREGRQAARDRHLPAVVHPQRRPRRRPARDDARARPRARLGARLHAPPLRELGGRPQRRLADQPAALLRRPVPGLVPPRRGRQPGARRPDRRRRGVAAGGPVLRAGSGLHRGPARRARRFHRGPGRDGHLGDLVDEPAHRLRLGARRRPVRPHLPDGPQHPRARDHPHLAVLPHRAVALRERLPALATLDDLRASWSTPTARR